MSLLGTTAKQAGKIVAKKTGIEILRKASDVFDEIYTEIFGVKDLNKGEDERIKQDSSDNQSDPEMKHISKWTEEDLHKVMQSDAYKYDPQTQKKVKKYFDLKYPGNQKYDATGRPIY